VSELAQDYIAAKTIVAESLAGNSDASIFLAKAQKNLLLAALLKGYANKINEMANDLSIEGKIKTSNDGKAISKTLYAQADLILHGICARVRDSWSGLGENPIPESKTILNSQRVIGTPTKILSTKSELIRDYGDLSRFMTGENYDTLVRKEKKLLFKAKTSLPIICDFVPEKVLSVLQIKGKGTSSVFLNYFSSRIKKSKEM